MQALVLYSASVGVELIAGAVISEIERHARELRLVINVKMTYERAKRQ